MLEGEPTIYTFKQPAEGGYYYAIVRADTDEEAAAYIADVADLFEHPTGKLQLISRYSEDKLVLEPVMQKKLDETGYVLRFVSQ